MERKFCGKCGKPLNECTCEKSEDKFGSANFAEKHSEAEANNQSGSYYIERFDTIALAQGEVVVRQYHIGEFAKGLNKTGRGNASIIITNKRVISKQDSDTTGSSSISIEEINLESITGVNNLYSQGYTIWRIVAAVILGIIGISLFFSSFSHGIALFRLLIGIVFLVLTVDMAKKIRQPSYLFSVYAASTAKALTTGANLRGKLFNSGGYGLVFQYKPTYEAVHMMREMGACIMDLKNKGDYAIEGWKQK